MAEDAVRHELEAHRAAMDAVAGIAADIVRAADLAAGAIEAGGRVLFCGNGGFAADAQHFAAELVGRYLKDRAAWPAIALTTNSSEVTAIANDYGFEEVFARQVQAHGRAGDVLVAISTSGDSANCLRAAEVAKHAGMMVVAMTGRDGGALGRACDVHLNVPVAATPRIQEAHAFIGHVLCGLVEERLSGER